MVNHLAKLSEQGQHKWLGPDGKWYEILKDGLLCRDVYDDRVLASYPWSEIPDSVLTAILANNKKDIKTSDPLTEEYAIEWIKKEKDPGRRASAIAWYRKLFRKDDQALKKLFEKPLASDLPF